MKITTETRHFQLNDGPSRIHHALKIESTPTPAICSYLRLPTHELLTGTSGILAEPLTTGVSRLYLARYNEVAEAQAKASLRAFAATLVGSVVATGSCMLLAPYVGAAALTVSGVVCVTLPILYLGSVLRGKIETRALWAACVLSVGYDDLAKASATDAMAERYEKAMLTVLREASTLGYIDERLEPVCRQYAARYNEKFGEDYVVV